MTYLVVISSYIVEISVVGVIRMRLKTSLVGLMVSKGMNIRYSSQEITISDSKIIQRSVLNYLKTTLVSPIWRIIV